MTGYDESQAGVYQDWGAPVEQQQDNGQAWAQFTAPAEQGATYGAGPNAGMAPQPQISQPPAQWQPPMPTYQEGGQQFQPQYQQPAPQPQYQQYPNQQPQFGQPNQPQYAGQQIAPPQALSPQAYFAQQPQYQQPPSPGQQMYPSGPVDQYGQPMQPQYQPQYGYPQQQGFPPQQQYDPYANSAGGQMYNPQQQYSQPQQTQHNPLAQYDSKIQEIEQKLAASTAALAHATAQGDPVALQLATEQARIQGEMFTAMNQRGQAEQQYSAQRMQGVRQQYSQGYERMATSMLGLQVNDNDRREFQQYMDNLMTPGSEDTFSNPYVQDTMLKAYAFDKMMAQRRGGPVTNGQRMAPRGDYMPNMQGTQGGFPQQRGPQPGQPIGFQALDTAQRTNFLATGSILPQQRR